MDRHCEAGMTGQGVDQEWRVGPGRHWDIVDGRPPQGQTGRISFWPAWHHWLLRGYFQTFGWKSIKCLIAFVQDFSNNPEWNSIVNADLIWLFLSISECYIGSSCLSVDQWQRVYTQLGLWQRQTPPVDFPPNSQGWPLQTGQILVPLPLHITFSSPFRLLSSCVRALPRPKWSADQMISQGVQTY